MLSLQHDIETGQDRLLIHNPFAVAWIGHYRRLTSDFERVKEVHNWRLYVQRAPPPAYNPLRHQFAGRELQRGEG